MTKTTLLTVASVLNSLDTTDEAIIAARDAVNAEVAKGEAKAQANREMYSEAKEAVMAVISVEEPMTVAQIYEACKDDLPENFSKSKVQYGVREYWADELVKHDNGKNAFTYTKKA